MVESPCGCKLQCYQNIPLEQRTKLFDGFWASGSYNVQNAYICGCVKITKVARCYTSQGDKSRRSFSRSYYVTNYDVSTRVCKKAFLQIHGLSNGRLSRALEAQRNEVKVEWLKIRWINVDKDRPLQFRYRYTHNELEEWKVVEGGGRWWMSSVYQRDGLQMWGKLSYLSFMPHHGRSRKLS